MNWPVDIIIASRNYARFLPEAIESALAQEDADVRVTVVDDHSTDDTAAVLARYASAGVRHLRLTGATGLGAGRNFGVSATDRPFIAFLDADDVFPPGRTRLLAELLDEAGTDMAHGHSSNFLDGTPPRETDDVLPGAVGTTVLHRREVFATVGPMDEQLPHLSYPEWLVRAKASGLTLASTTAVVTWRRIHDSNISRNSDKPADMLAIVRRHLGSSKGMGAGNDLP